MAVLLDGGNVVSTSSDWPGGALGQVGNGAHPLQEYYRSSSYEQMYICQPSVRKVIDKRGSLQAIVPFKVYRRNSDDTRESGRTSDFGRLTANPSPGESTRTWRKWHHMIRDIHGISFGALLRDDRHRVGEVAPIHPMKVRYGTKSKKAVDYNPSMLTAAERDSGNTYWYVADQYTEIHFPRRNLFVNRHIHPAKSFWGLSKLESLRSTLEDDAAARAAMEALWKRGARPHYALKTKDDMSEHPAVVQQIRDDALEAHGGVPKWWAPMVLDGGMDITELRTETGLEYLGLRNLTDIEVGAVYDLSGAVIHNHEDSTFNNIHEIYQDVFRSAMADVLGQFEADWNHDVRDGRHGENVAPNFPDAFYAEHDTAGVLRGSPEKVIEAGSTEIQTGQLSINEFRAKQNRPPVEGGDEVMVNAALVPLTMAGQNSASADPKLATPLVEPPGTSKGMVGAEAASLVMGHLSRVAQVEDIDVAKLTEGLAGWPSMAVTGAVETAIETQSTVPELRDMIRKLEL